MKSYNCLHCHNPLYFENSQCLKCGYTVGFNSYFLNFVTLSEEPNNQHFSNVNNAEEKYKFCKNATHGTCNWLLPVWSEEVFCTACSLNRTIPSLDNAENKERWKLIEIAKHRLIYSLLKIGLPVEAKTDKESNGIWFDFVESLSPNKKILTGHKDGIITLNIEEADEILRVSNKNQLGEKYRTLLGHFRHEIGHYYWDVLIRDSTYLEEYRNVFGDERADYSEALELYYKQPRDLNWNQNYISSYASAHSWEDWAETWAHYLHMMDTLETAFAFGIDIETNTPGIHVDINTDPYQIKSFEEIMEMWLPLSFATNSLARSMGHQDFYPFIISETVVKKLSFIHEVCGTVR